MRSLKFKRGLIMVVHARDKSFKNQEWSDPEPMPEPQPKPQPKPESGLN